MKKVSILAMVLIISVWVILSLNTLSQKSFNDAILHQTKLDGVTSIEATIYFNFYNFKTFRVENSDDKAQLLDYLNAFRLKKVNNDVVAYTSDQIHAIGLSIKQHSGTSDINFRIDASGGITLDNGDRFKVTEPLDIMKIYEIVLMAQDPNQTDKFYYYLINANK